MFEKGGLGDLKCVCVECCSRGTDTLEAARGVLALAATTEERIQQTLVNVLTVLPGVIQLVAGVGSAPVGAREVLTGPVTADIRALTGTFVDVDPAVREAAPVRTELVVLPGAGPRTGSAGTAPAHPVREGHGAAATAGLGDRLDGGVETLPVTVREHGVAQPQHSVV